MVLYILDVYNLWFILELMNVYFIFENDVLIIDLINIEEFELLSYVIKSLWVFYYFMGVLFGCFNCVMVIFFGGDNIGL